MKIGFYDDFRPCILRESGMVDISREVRALQGGSPQLLLENIIANFQLLRPRLERLQARGKVIPLGQVRLRPPVPRPGKVLCGQGNFMEGVPVSPVRPLSTFFKSPDAAIGPGDTIVFPSFRPVIFHHEAELSVVIGRAMHNVPEAQALDYVFGYTTSVDVSARAPVEGEAPLPGNYGKSFDTFLPIGPAITTADEVRDPNSLHVRYWVNGQLRQDYNTSDMEHSVAYTLAALSAVMTLKPGDLIMAGTNHQGLGPLQDGDVGEIEIEKVGRSSNPVVDSLKRTWPQAVDPSVGRGLRERRASMNGTPSAGTWPLTKPVGVPTPAATDPRGRR
ncbi:MAG: fumarylacetoacetate hydrolase family protein [Chloroflexi bacterium]|nr:fumarylacetoacetate hydrolase family protein [Chloroflexota bacterium]